MFDLIQLKQLVSVAENKTISAAACDVALSQSALTRSIQRLEEDLGVELFERGKNKVELNSNGKIAVFYAKEILSKAQEMKTELLRNDKKHSTITVVSCAPGPGWYLEEKIKTEFPDKKFECEIQDTEIILNSFKTGKYDYAILPFNCENLKESFLNTTDPHKFKCKKLCTEELFFSLPKTHRFAKHKNGIHFSDIDGEDFLVFSKIGFWHEIHRQNLPSSKFLIQNDNYTHEQLIKNSTLPCFVTNFSLKYIKRPTVNRSIIPILDDTARIDFFLWER